MALTEGDLLQWQQRNLAGFGTHLSGWGPADRIDFETPFPRLPPSLPGSGLREPANPALQLLFGGTSLFLPKNSSRYRVSPDVAAHAAPGVALQPALRRQLRPAA
jgi:hypothetical protein